MIEPVVIQPFVTRRNRRSFVGFPWRLYRDGSNGAPALMRERHEYLDPAKGFFSEQAGSAQRGQGVR